MTARPFRIIDTGLRDGRWNIAFDQALIEARQDGLIADTIRFLRFPPTALVGRHQDLGKEINLAHCRAAGVGVARRITGGGAIYFDPGQLGWELVFRRSTFDFADLGAAARAICEAAAAGLSSLGVDARFRPRNDIEVAGRKLSGTGGFYDGDVLFYQGTLLIDMDPADMLAALNVPKAKLAKRGLDDAAGRVVTLRELLGDRLPDLAEIQEALARGFREHLGVDPRPDTVSEAETSLADELFDDEIGTDEFVAAIDAPGAAAGVRSATHAGPGGTVTAYMRLEGPTDARIREVLITGDFFAAPPRIVFDLEARLRGTTTAEIAATVDAFFTENRAEVLSLGADDFKRVLTAAAADRAAA
ncbi:MAG: biotin/lipoate A/B protein ligase family protein [Magnetovibrio sp.]|nr:biotin/lipoate A/B protein ligase family protein [Magnetovibrio sp.]